MKKWIGGILLAILCVMQCACSEGADHVIVIGKEAAMQESLPPEDTPAPAVCIVYVCGAVNAPGVIVLPKGSRVLDALTAAGGFAEGADKLHVNLADWVLDGSRIYFPTMEETKELTSLRFLEDGEEACELVNINTAGVDRLMTLPGVGESKAKDIIAYRERNGDYETVDDIMKVPGIKESIFDKIRDLITVGSG